MAQLVKLLFVLLLHISIAAVVKRGSLRRSRVKNVKSHSMVKLHPYYHTTDAIHEELVSLSSRCPGMTLESKKAGDRSIDVVTIKKPHSSPANKNFLLFGEHARELISPESGFHFIKTLCGEVGDRDRTATVLQDNEFQIVVNGNPGSRQRVEQGDFCLRVNPNGVDLNRNWAEKWEAQEHSYPGQDTYPGPKPFSEPETRIFRELATKYNPTNFLTVHSGTKGMYMPWAYDMEHLANRNQPAMMQILKALDEDHCQCPFGAAGRQVGYSCPGTCLDWVYDELKTPYAFAFEIYTDPAQDQILKRRWLSKLRSGAGEFFQNHSHLGHQHFREIFEQRPSDFVQLQSQSHGHEMSARECFSMFNPDTKELFDKTVENWSAAYLDMAEMIAKNLKAEFGQPVLAQNTSM